MGSKLRFFLGIVILSPALFVVWELWAREPYIAFLKRIGSVFFLDIGPEGTVVPVSVSNVVPFLVLMLATPGIPGLRRVKRVCLGVAVLLPFHLASVLFFTHWMRNPAPSSLRMFASLLVSGVMMALPFALWVAFAREPIRDFISGVRSTTRPPSMAESDHG